MSLLRCSTWLHGYCMDAAIMWCLALICGHVLVSVRHYSTGKCVAVSGSCTPILPFHSMFIHRIPFLHVLLTAWYTHMLVCRESVNVEKSNYESGDLLHIHTRGMHQEVDGNISVSINYHDLVWFPRQTFTQAADGRKDGGFMHCKPTPKSTTRN